MMQTKRRDQLELPIQQYSLDPYEEDKIEAEEFDEDDDQE